MYVMCQFNSTNPQSPVKHGVQAMPKLVVYCTVLCCMFKVINTNSFTVGIWSCDFVVSYSTKAEVEWEVSEYHCISTVSIILAV